MRYWVLMAVCLSLAVMSFTASAQVYSNERRFNAAQNTRADEIMAKGALLHGLFAPVESQLAEKGFDADRLAEEGLSWIAVASDTHDELAIVGLYRREDELLTRLDIWHVEDDEWTPASIDEAPRHLRYAEWALLLAETNCGQSFAVIALPESDDDSEIYVIQIGDSDHVVLGRNFHVRVADGGVEGMQIMSRYCAERRVASQTAQRPLGYYDHNPAVDFPTEVHALHALRYADFPHEITVMARGGQYTFRGGELSRRFIILR